MKYMLCRNDLRDYETWRRHFDADTEAHREAGLILAHIWRQADAPQTVYFLFEIQSEEKAKAFINAPDAKVQGQKAGVTDGDYKFLDSVPNYKAA